MSVQSKSKKVSPPLRSAITFRAAQDGNPSAIIRRCFTTEDGGRPLSAPFQLEWDEMIAANPRTQIEVARNHTKSTWAQALVLGKLGTDTNCLVKVLSADPELSTSFTDTVGEQIERNVKLQDVFPWLRPYKQGDWSKHKLTVERELIHRDPSLESWGIYQGHTGGRCNLMVVDDPCNWRNTLGNPKLMDKTKDALRRNWFPFVNPQGGIVWLDTPWAVNDASAEIRNDPSWAHWRGPAVNADGIPLWPQRFPPEALERIRRDCKSDRIWRQQYMLDPFSTEETLFPSALVEGMFDPWVKVPRLEPGWLVVGGVDLARSLTEGASYTVCVTAAVKPDGTRILLDVWRERLQPVPTWERLGNDWRQWHHHSLMVESNAYQMAAVDYLQRNVAGAEKAIQGFSTGIQKRDLEVGLPGLAARLGLWRVPMGDQAHETDCDCARCELRAELLAYPFGAYSDCVMALWFADSAAEQLARGNAPRIAGAVGGSRMFGR